MLLAKVTVLANVCLQYCKASKKANDFGIE